MQVQIQLATCRRFATARISDNGPDYTPFFRSTMPQKQFKKLLVPMTKTEVFLVYVKGTVMQTEKALINDRLRVLKVS